MLKKETIPYNASHSHILSQPLIIDELHIALCLICQERGRRTAHAKYNANLMNKIQINTASNQRKNKGRTNHHLQMVRIDNNFIKLC